MFFRIVEKNICTFKFDWSATKHSRRDTVNETCAFIAILELVELKAAKTNGKISTAIFRCPRGVTR
jgi:hypothetical protein